MTIEGKAQNQVGLVDAPRGGAEMLATLAESKDEAVALKRDITGVLLLGKGPPDGQACIMRGGNQPGGTCM
jgi:hypothetical protein